MPLFLRTVSADLTAHGGFRWPSEIGAVVVAPDWNPAPVCGGGLHGLLWGEGDVLYLSRNPHAIWQVVESDDEIVDLDGKHKFRSCILRYIGDRAGAVEYILANGGAGRRVCYASVTVGDGETATAGYRGTATAGYQGTATAGYFGTATAGDRGTATAGDGGTATAGDGGTATAGDGGTATAGHFGTATAGYGGTATAGYGGTATAGYDGRVSAGDSGRLVLDDAYGISFTRQVGKGGIEPNTFYRLEVDEFVRC